MCQYYSMSQKLKCNILILMLKSFIQKIEDTEQIELHNYSSFSTTIPGKSIGKYKQNFERIIEYCGERRKVAKYVET